MVGHVVRQQVGHGEASAVLPLTQGDGFGAELAKLRDVLVQTGFEGAPVGGVTVHVSVVRISATVFAVFVAVVEQRRARRGQQPTVGLKRSVVGGHVAWLPGKSVLCPLIVGVAGARVGSAGQSRDIVAPNVRDHQRARSVLVLASVGPKVEVLVILVSRNEDVVDHGMVQDKVGLPVQPVRAHVSVDGIVLSLIGLQRMAGPSHGGFAFQVDVVAHRLKALVDLSHQV